MSVHLDWQQDLEEEGWPRKDHAPPPRRSPPWLRWLLLAIFAMVVGGAIAVWQLSNTGLRSAKADLQEAVAHSHWILQQADQVLFQRALDPTSPSWQNALLADWDALVASAQTTEAPTVESIQLHGSLAEAVVHWEDATTGQPYISRRWFRLIDGQWRWTKPRDEGWGNRLTETRPHVTLHFYTGEGEIVGPILDELDALVAAQCDRYRVTGDDCHLHIAWDLLDPEGRPLAWRDLPLPLLATATADEMDGSIYIMGVSDPDWRSRSVRLRVSSFYPGQSYVAQSKLEIQRPAGLTRLPNALPGEAGAPLQLPSPWLVGLNSGQPHPRWQAHTQRIVADAILRRAQGPLIGSARFVNAAWALHQALLALDHGVPALNRLAEPGPQTLGEESPGEIPDLGSLGAALQSHPDNIALRQLADLVTFLRGHWEDEELLDLAPGMGVHAFTGPLLEDTLGMDESSFLAQWRSEQRERTDSPLAELVTLLEQQMRAEAEAWSLRNEAQALASYTQDGQAWRQQYGPETPFDFVPLDSTWQVSVAAIGTLEQVVWVEVIEENDQRRVGDLRFFRQDEDGQWLRDAPDIRLWGEPATANSELITWHFFEADETAVLAVQEEIEANYHALQARLQLPLEPITITVSAHGLADQNDQPSDGNVLWVASPRRHRLSDGQHPEQDALRRNVAVPLSFHQIRRKMDQMGIAGDPEPELWAIFLGLMRAELRHWQVADELLYRDMDVAIGRAVETDLPPAIAEILASPGVGARSLERSARMLLTTYIIENHGDQWIEALLNRGLPATLETLIAEQGWTWQELEADWHQYLRSRFSNPVE